MSESQAECLNGVLLAACMGLFSRYVEGSRAAAEDADGAKLQPVTSSCVLNISTSKRKMSDQQGAVDSCLEALEIDPSNTKALWSPRMARIKKNMFKHWLVLRKLRR